MLNKQLNRADVEDLLKASLNEIDNSNVGEENDLGLNKVLDSYRSILAGDTVDRAMLCQIEKNVDTRVSNNLRIRYHQVLIYKFYLDNYKLIDDQNFPQGVSDYLKEDFSRIINYAKVGNPKNLTFDNFQFFSYLQKMCFKCFPVSHQNIDVTGFSRNLIFRQTFLNKLNFLRVVLGMGGNYPLFEMHFNPHRSRLFSPEGWDEVFRLAAQMLVNHPHMKGVFGASWFFDPSLKEISNELNYIRELIEKIGGHFFVVGSSEDDMKNAFAFSKERKAAYEEGRYIPTSYMVVIKRDTLIRYYC